MWKQAPHNVLDSIGFIQARGLSSSQQSLGDYFEGVGLAVLRRHLNGVARPGGRGALRLGGSPLCLLFLFLNP